jgi:glycosyltransferase involved in cell wall biosynthesis
MEVMPHSVRGGVPRTALVHDFLLDLRGAERVFAELCDMSPDADVFTAVYDEDGTEGRFANRRVRTSFLQRLHPTSRTFRALLPLYPYAMEALDLRGYQLVISSSSAWAHGVLVDDDATHVCYCHNPFRYAWNARETALAGRSGLARAVLTPILQRWRQWDWIAAQRVDHYIANSDVTRRRIARCFNRDADVVYPPVRVERFTPARIGDHYVVLSELMRHKRIDVAIDAFNRMRRPLLIVGDGPDDRRLRALAGPTIRFSGRVSDPEAAALLARARALVTVASEEFGIAAVEAQAAGRPVIALRDGGVCETVREGVTGTFFPAPDADALIAAVERFDVHAVDPHACVANAARFDAAAFREGIRRVVDEGGERGASPREPRRPTRARGLATRPRAKAPTAAEPARRAKAARLR